MISHKDEQRYRFKQRLYSFSLKLMEMIDKMPRDMISNRIGDQLLRSGTSILGNYVEGQSSSSKRDFANFLNHSLKSANESKVWIALLRDSKRIDFDQASWFLSELKEISNIFGASLLTVRGKRKSGLF